MLGGHLPWSLRLCGSLAFHSASWPARAADASSVGGTASGPAQSVGRSLQPGAGPISRTPFWRRDSDDEIVSRAPGCRLFGVHVAMLIRRERKGKRPPALRPLQLNQTATTISPCPSAAVAKTPHVPGQTQTADGHTDYRSPLRFRLTIFLIFGLLLLGFLIDLYSPRPSSARRRLMAETDLLNFSAAICGDAIRMTQSSRSGQSVVRVSSEFMSTMVRGSPRPARGWVRLCSSRPVASDTLSPTPAKCGLPRERQLQHR
jgi:hypothetical protein